jgi:lipopolysaccharide transport system permease protein
MSIVAQFGRDLRDALLQPPLACREHAGLLRMLVKREVVNRSSGTVLGKLWPLLQPALQVLGFWFVFDIVYGTSELRGSDFLEYLLAGILPWLLLTEVLTRSAHLFREFAALYRRSPFPIELLPLLILVIPGAVYGIVYAAVVLAFHGPLAALAALLVVALLLLWLLPLLWLFAVLGLFLRDFAQALPFVLMLIMYATPILYFPDMLPPGMQEWLWLNPFADLVAVIHAAVEPGAIDWNSVARLAVIWLVLLAPCRAVFRRSLPHVREVL